MGTNDVATNVAQSLVPIVNFENTSPSKASAFVDLDEDYARFLRLCNGGYTRDGYFHFFGTTGPARHNVFEWNDPALWKHEFGVDDSFVVFAEDLFGNQYGFVRCRRRRVTKLLSTMTGKLTICPEGFEGVVEYLVMDDEDDEDRQLARQYFQTKAEQPRAFTHLSYVHLPCLGGDPTDIDNLDLIDSLVNLRITGQILSQVRDLAPGTTIERIDVDEETQSVRLVTG